VRVADPFLFLCGSRRAIERIASDRRAWVTGALLVLSAGVARNYDHLDLRSDPEWFVGPFAASLVSILFIFACLAGPLRLVRQGPLGPQLLTFLTLAWLTAPCAWLYGLPVEAMTDIVTATRWNIAFLAIVSVWRVALMTRAVSLLAGVRWQRALPLVLAPAALEAMLGSWWKGMSLVQIMGGVRLPPHEQILQNAAHIAATLSFWIFLASIVAAFATRGVATARLDRPRRRSSVLPAVAALAALAIGLVLSIPHQARVGNQRWLEVLVRDGRYDDAAAFASERTRADFPPTHALPPGARRFPPELLGALAPDAPDWLRRTWHRDALESLTTHGSLSAERVREFERYHPGIRRLLREHADGLRSRPPERLSFLESRWLERFDEIDAPAP